MSVKGKYFKFDSSTAKFLLHSLQKYLGWGSAAKV